MEVKDLYHTSLEARQQRAKYLEDNKDVCEGLEFLMSKVQAGNLYERRFNKQMFKSYIEGHLGTPENYLQAYNCAYEDTLEFMKLDNSGQILYTIKDVYKNWQ